ncbi:hypothetical protein M8J77_015139 [Diaphorina citri]|nr:hypothetical protein M8J77_015139 [Diaphorina citri]
MGYLNSTPIDNILVECRENPMSKRTPQLVDRFVLKVISSQTALAAKLNTLTVTHMTSKYCKTKPTPPIVNSYCNISHQYGRELITYEKPIIYNYDYDIGKVSLQSETFNEYRKHPDSLQDAALSSEIQEKCPNAICIYTDASKKNEKVGAAWFCPTYKSKACFKLHPATSTYTAEVIGIWEALKYSASLKNNEILILTDSKSACQKLSKNCLNTTPTHLELEILSSYKHLQNTCKTVKLAWIKGHEDQNSFSNNAFDAIKRTSINTPREREEKEREIVIQGGGGGGGGGEGGGGGRRGEGGEGGGEGRKLVQVFIADLSQTGAYYY